MIRGQRLVVLGRIDREPCGLADRHRHHASRVPGLTVDAGTLPGSACHPLHAWHFAPCGAGWEHRTGVRDFGYPDWGIVRKSDTFSEVSGGEMMLDPVCDMVVDLAEQREQGLTIERPEREYAFCSAGCLERFAKDPKRYIGKVERWLATGESAPPRM